MKSINYKESSWGIHYMFDIPEPYCDYHQIMLGCDKFKMFKDVFYNDPTLDKLNEFSVISNVHADYPLGVYLVHKDWVENPFMKSDDFHEWFTIKDYVSLRPHYTKTKDYNFLDQLERFKDVPFIAKYSYPYYQTEEAMKNLKLKTTWTITTYNDKAIALTSKEDSWRLPNQTYFHSGLSESVIKIESEKFKSFRVNSVEQGLEYLKEFK